MSGKQQDAPRTGTRQARGGGRSSSTVAVSRSRSGWSVAHGGTARRLCAVSPAAAADRPAPGERRAGFRMGPAPGRLGASAVPAGAAMGCRDMWLVESPGPVLVRTAVPRHDFRWRQAKGSRKGAELRPDREPGLDPACRAHPTELRHRRPSAVIHGVPRLPSCPEDIRRRRRAGHDANIFRYRHVSSPRSMPDVPQNGRPPASPGDPTAGRWPSARAPCGTWCRN